MKYRIDVMRLREGTMTLNGWAIPKGRKEKNYTEIPSEQSSGKRAGGLQFSVTDRGGNRLPLQYVPMLREDVAQIYKSDPMCGFDLQFPYERGGSYFLTIEAAGERVRRGEAVARAGATGDATGPHLHLELRMKGIRLNPAGALGLYD